MRRIYLGLIAFIISSGMHTLYAQTLIHYWNFNNTNSYAEHTAPTSSLISGAALDTNLYTGGSSLLDYTAGTGQGFDVDNFNARNGDASGNHCRFNAPIYGALVYSLPTTGFKDIQMKYAGMRSGSGAYYQFIEYSTDGSNYTLFDTIEPTTSPVLYTLDFSAINAINDNANFKVRIRFGQGGGGTGGNNRFDNVTLEGNSLSGQDQFPPVVTIDPSDMSVNVPVDVMPTLSFNEDIRLLNDLAIGNPDSLVIFKLNNENGADVPFSSSYSNKVITITPNSNLLNNQTYYLAIKKNRVEDASDNALTADNGISFSTISIQTIFNPGDIVPIAYRMNATNTEDEVALLTLVNILPGTLINMADAKYTDNAQAQCAGGLTWTAPQTGVAAGTVIVIQNDVPSASVGDIAGSGFGLSSGGDQFIVYTGSPASPTHVTALTSNDWVLNNTSCSGSNSKIPATLADGVSSVNLSTAPGNVSGNTANAYYHGPMDLPYNQLKDSILDPANWTGVGSSTPPQDWPVWSFNGPPAIVDAYVASATSIQIAFNKDLDPVSSVNTANFTGITGLTSVSRTQNGSLADTLTLQYSNAFMQAGSYSLTVDQVKDAENTSMFAPYTFNFTYNSEISFDETFVVVNENMGTLKLKVNIKNPSASTVTASLKTNSSTAQSGSDITFTSQNLQFTGSETMLELNIPILDDSQAEADEYFVLELSNVNGAQLVGQTFATVYILDNDKVAPVANKEIELNHLGSFQPDAQGSSTCEIVAYDSASKRIFITSAIEDRLDIANFSDPSNVSIIKSIDMSSYGGITSVAVHNGIVAVASPAPLESDPGKAVFFDTEGTFIAQVTVGALPDMITFTHDGTKVLVANEGQPNSDYSVDPEGSVTVIDISAGVQTLTQSNVTQVLFTPFNAQESTLVASGVRKTFAASTMAQDFEPEYITVSKDSKKAWITLQENNAIAELDLTTNTFTSVWALGTKDWMSSGAGFDASDRSNEILIAPWPVKSFYIPDALASYSVNGVNYIVTANEGDEKEYDNLNERTTVGSGSYVLDATAYPQAAMLKLDENLGRFRVTNLNGDTDNDGDFDQIFSLGARSFSIFNADNKTIVYDSKDDFEQIISQDTNYVSLFNADNEENGAKGRSRAKGPEPEGVCLAVINKETYAFIGLERVGGVMVYNISNPQSPVFVDYLNTRTVEQFGGDQAPEGIIYISPSQSPDNEHYVLVANEISGTVAIFRLKVNTNNSISGVKTNAPVLFAYPNPSNGSNIQLNRSIQGVVVDVTGATVAELNDQDTISTESMANGIYFVKSNDGAVVRFIVHK